MGTGWAEAPERTAQDVLKDAYLWLDASARDTMTVSGANKDVTLWNSLKGGASAKTYTLTNQNAPSPNAPQLVEVGGRALVSFGTNSSNRDLRFGSGDGTDGSTSIRAVYLVGKVQQSPDAFLLGHQEKYHFHRGPECQYWATYDSANITGGETRRNGVRVENPLDELLPTGFGLVSVYTSGDVSANQICYDRPGVPEPRHGGKDVAELIILNAEVAAGDRKLVEDYLLDKWIYTADVTAATAAWSSKEGLASSSEWVDGKAVLINNTQDEATLALDGSVSAISFGVASAAGKNLTLTKADDATLTSPYGYDFSAAEGRVTVAFNPGATAVSAGRETVLTRLGTGEVTAGIGKSAVLYVAEGEAATAEGAFTGGGRVVKTGKGALTLAVNNSFTGGLEVREGLLKTTAQTGFGPYADRAGLDSLSKIAVRNGATLDLANSANVCYDVTIEGAGVDGKGALVNTGDEIGSGSRQTTRITLAGDATVGGTANYGLLASGYGRTYLNLAGNTLTKIGGHTFWFKTTEVQGNGTVAVKEGAVKMENNGENHVTATGSTIVLGESGTLELNDPAPVGINAKVQPGGVLALHQSQSGKNGCTYSFEGGTLRRMDGASVLTAETLAIAGEGSVFDANGGTLRIDCAMSGEGAIRLSNASSSAGVVEFGPAARPAGVLTVDSNVKVQLRFASDDEVPTLRFASEPAEGSVVLLDADGSVAVGATSAYDPATGTMTFHRNRLIWAKGDTNSFEADANWTRSPKDGEDVVVQIDGDTEIDVALAHKFGRVAFSGAGRVTFTGAGLIAADRTDVPGGADVVYPARYQFGALTVAENATATSEGGATVASTAGDGTFAVTNGTLALGEGGNVKQILGSRHIRIDAGGALELRGRDMVTVGGNASATVTVNAGGKLSTFAFNRLPKVKLYGGEVEAADNLFGNTTWRSVCYNNGVEAGGGTTSRLTSPKGMDHQLMDATFMVESDSTLVVDAPLGDGATDNGVRTGVLRKTGAGALIVNASPAYSGVTDIQEGDYILNAAHNAAANYKVARNASLSGTGSVAGSGKVELGYEGVLGGSLKIAHLFYSSGARIGNANCEADVTVTDALENNGTYDDGIAWIDVKNGTLTIGAGLELPAPLRFNIQNNGAQGVGTVAAGAGDRPVKAVNADQLEMHGEGTTLASEVKVVDGVVKTGAFEIDGDLDLANRLVALKVVGDARPPARVPVVTLAAGKSFRNFSRKAVPAGQKYAYLDIDGQTLYYNANRRLVILVQ